MPNKNQIVNPKGFDLYYVNTSPQEFTGSFADCLPTGLYLNQVFYETNPFVVYDGTTMYKVPRTFCPLYLVKDGYINDINNIPYTAFQVCCLESFNIYQDKRYLNFYSKANHEAYVGDDISQLWDTRSMTTIVDDIILWEDIDLPVSELTLARNHVVKIRLYPVNQDENSLLWIYWRSSHHLSFGNLPDEPTIEMFNGYYQNVKWFNGFCFQNDITARLNVSGYLKLPLDI